MVREFHEVFGALAPDEPTTEIPEDLGGLRKGLLQEELTESLEALNDRDPIALAKEAADLVYVALGTLISLGVDPDEAVRLVHKSNMSKLYRCGTCQGVGRVWSEEGPCHKCNGSGKQVLSRSDGKILKGPNYKPPDMSVLFK